MHIIHQVYKGEIFMEFLRLKLNVVRNICVIMQIFLIIGCNANQKEFRVAYIARAQADSFAAWLANSVEKEAENYDDIEMVIFDGQASDDKQNSLIENAIVNQFDAIIIQPNNGESQRPYAEKVVQAGIACITTNARIDGIVGASSVDADPYEQAALQARLGIQQIPQGANVVVLNGPSGNFHADQRRLSWQKEFFDQRPDVTIVAEQIANWNKDEAMNYMEDWIQAHDDIAAIISMNDNMASGALEVIKGKPEFANVLVYGVDGTAEAALLIKEGRMTSTTFQNAYELAENLLSVTHKLLTGEESQIDINIGNPVIDKNNVNSCIEIHERAGNL